MISPLPKDTKKAHELKDDDLICHCYGYTKRDIEEDYLKNSRSLIFEKIASEKKAGRCQCTTKNPKGI
ncbi:MAG: hypothetical protein N3D15_06920 [Syntrophorhabdaceae bacterium]|nr:hypothetical protein [Syntrophorhabdaceae bacterium]